MAPTVNAAAGARPPADPTGIELHYSHRHRWDTSTEDMPELWHVSADIPNTEDDDGQPVTVHVGDIEIARVNPYRGDAFDRLDGHSIDLARIGEVALDTGSGGLHPDLEDRLDGHGTDLLILDRARLVPAWRGYGIGVLLAGVAIQRLSGGCQAALCIPGSLIDDDGEAPRDEDPSHTQEAQARLAEVWAQLGFEHFRNGVYVLDLAYTTLGEAIKQLGERINRYR